MEKFAVDLDKVLDDFELDEDVSVSVNQYDKLQLEFCPEGASSLPPASSRHNVGLGAFGGWSEPLPQVVGGGGVQQGWCGASLGHPPQPPGTRSPPDGQNDDSEQTVACSNPSLPYHAGAQYPQPPLPQPSHMPSVPALDRNDDNFSLPSQSGEVLWPAMASSLAAKPSQPTTSKGTPQPSMVELPDSQGPTESNCQVPGQNMPIPRQGVSQENMAGEGMRAPDMVNEPDTAVSHPVACGGLDVIGSRPLDVVPAAGPPDCSINTGHEGRHPDIIDVWQSGGEAGAVGLPNNEANGLEYANRECEQGRRGVDGIVDRSVDQAEHRLLPDLMSMNSVDSSSTSEGAMGGPDYPEPAIIKENALSDLQMNEPAIVMESQSCSRIPEVVNIHQTAEQQSLDEGQTGSHSMSGSAESSSHGVVRSSRETSHICDVPGVVQDHITPDCDIVDSRPSTSVVRSEYLESEAGRQRPLPDVSVVNPAPLAFNKDMDIDDAELDAELAELEEEQFRLQGAYGGQLYQPNELTVGAYSGEAAGENAPDNIKCKLPESGLVEGLDLIGSMTASSSHHSEKEENNASSLQNTEEPSTEDGIETDHTEDNSEAVAVSNALQEAVEELSSACVSAAGDIEAEVNDESSKGLGRQSDMRQATAEDSQETAERLSMTEHSEVGEVEEVVCKPQSSDLSADTPQGSNQLRNGSDATTRSVEGEGGDNISTNSTGTDTLSSSSTLTDGELGSPGRSNQPQPESPSRVTPGTLVTAVYDDDSGSGREDEGNPEAGAHGGGAAGGPMEGGSMVGHVAPFWIPDEDAPNCQECGQKFTVIRRRHHCRACGRVLCATCCHDKAQLPYMDYKEARVCGSCLQLIFAGQQDDHSGSSSMHPPSDSGRRLPDPNNPMEYCSRVPPPQQVSASSSAPPPTVMVPVGVLKREGSSSSARSRGNKQVIFSDGIRPGGDLTELDGSGEVPPPYRRTGRSARRVDRPSTGGGGGSGMGGLLRSLPPDRCLIPPGTGLPPVVVQAPATGEYVFEDNPDSSKLESQMRGDGPPVVFAVHKNLTVLVKMVKLECCVGVEVWNIATRGLCTVGQEELVVLLEVAPGETHPPRDIFAFFHSVYQQANQGNLVTELGHTIFTEPEGFLGSREHGGFLYIRPTFQCLRNLVLPPSPYIFAVLIQKWETPWAKVFPLRLMLRMGAEFRYYPCPLVSTRNRKPVFCEIGHTIMNLLVDFRNYAYTVPAVEGFVIHMEDKRTSLLFPKNRYEQVAKALSNSNDHVLALAANFSPQADSHLVTIEDDNGHYSTQAINIHNRPRKVTGASFIVFNGALKTTSGLSAKSSIVEDGLMVQIPSDMMTKLREALRNMKNFKIPCGPVSAPTPDEVVSIEWTSDDKNFNVGIKSPVDERKMDGVPSYKIHSGTDYVNNAHLIRWTEVFIMQGETNNSSDVNLSRLSEVLARAFCVALTPHLSDLYSSGLTRLALRTNIHQDNVGYEAGSSGSRLPSSCMNDLDTELIPVIHRAAASITDQPIILELLFHIMEQ